MSITIRGKSQSDGCGAYCPEPRLMPSVDTSSVASRRPDLTIDVVNKLGCRLPACPTRTHARAGGHSYDTQAVPRLRVWEVAFLVD